MSGVDAVDAVVDRPDKDVVSVAGAVLVPVNSLRPGYSPRLLGEDANHIQQLAVATTPIPPIAVHRQSMRVIDGMHRLYAAVRRGEKEIWVEYFDGDDSTAFLVAVQKNIAHGLPLTSDDRTAAVQRIIKSHPTWSNRAIAAVAGLSDKTVAAIRRRSTAEASQLHARLGLDGRVRPLDAAAGRRRASEIITQDPDASLRAIASGAAVSVRTARDVRERLRNGQDPLPDRRRGGHRQQDGPSRTTERQASPSAQKTAQPVRSIPDISILRRDPSLRLNESGRLLLRLLEAHTTAGDRWEQIVDAVPQHCVPAVANLAGGLADMWAELAQRLDARRTAYPE